MSRVKCLMVTSGFELTKMAITGPARFALKGNAKVGNLTSGFGQVPMLIGNCMNEHIHSIGNPELEKMTDEELKEKWLVKPFGADKVDAIIVAYRKLYPKSNALDVLSFVHAGGYRHRTNTQAERTKWPVYNKETGPVMVFDNKCEVKNDPDREARKWLLWALQQQDKAGAAGVKGRIHSRRPPGLQRFLRITHSSLQPGCVNSQLRLLWVACGTDDGLLGVNQQFRVGHWSTQECT